MVLCVLFTAAALEDDGPSLVLDWLKRMHFKPLLPHCEILELVLSVMATAAALEINGRLLVLDWLKQMH